MSTLNDKTNAKTYLPLAKRDRAKQEFLRRKPTAFPTRLERDAFLIEEAKNCASSDLRRLTDLIGREAVGDFIKSELSF